MDKQKISVGYKQTEVGVIPDDWDVKSLETLGNGIVPPIKAGPFGSSLTKDIYVAKGYKVYGQEQVIRGDYRYGDYYINEKKYRELSSCAVREGDVLLSLVGTAGKLLIISKDAEAGVINPRLLRFTFDKKIISSEFFKYMFESNFVQNLLSRAAQGGTMAVLNAGMLRILEIPIPSLKEQTAIANALSDVDALIAALEKLIDKKTAIKTATMQQLLTGKKRLPPFDQLDAGYKQTELGEIPKDWGVVELGNIGTTIIGLTYSPNDVADFGSLVLRSSNVQNNKLAFENNVFVNMDLPDRVIVSEGDILICVRNGSRQLIGKCALIDAKTSGSAFGAFMSIYRSDSNKFVFYQFQSNIIQNQINEVMGATINQITNKNMAGFRILLPKSKEEQTAIANVLSDMDTELDALQQRLAKTQHIKQGMMQELLTGKTRLVTV